MSFLNRITMMFRSEELDCDLDDELRSHIEMRTEDNIASGMSPNDARRDALLRFGNLTATKENARSVRIFAWLESLGRDLRYGLRQLRRSPGFAVVAVLTLALGIGATTALFSVVYGVLLKPLPFPGPERLVGVYHRAPGINLALMNQGPGTYFTYLDNNHVFEGLGAWDNKQVSITGPGEPERVPALAVTADTLPLLGVQPILGRRFSKEDDAPGSPRRVILTYGYWQRRFGGARDIVGRPLDVNGMPAEILGVLPASFQFLRTNPAILMPLQLNRADASFVSFDFQVLARLKPGVTLGQANADLARMIAILNSQVPAFTRFRLQANVQPLARDVTGDIGSILWILLAVAGVVLLIACTNVANLFLVRAEGRRQELAVRAALGARRGRIARQLLSESVALGFMAGAVGLLFAQAAIGLLRKLAPATLPRIDEIALSPPVLLFALAVSVLTGLLFGAIPVLRIKLLSVATLQGEAWGNSDAPARQRMRSAMAVAEIAMALALLIVSGLLIRTFVAMRDVQPGFVNPEQVQTFRIEVPEGIISEPRRMVQLHQEIAERLRQVPGVLSVGMSSSITMDGEDNANSLYIEHIQVPEGEPPVLRRFKTVAPGYFQAMGNPILAGRDVTWTDIYQQRPVVVISQELAREYWGSPAGALGRRVRGLSQLTPDRSLSAWYEVIGVVGNERDDGLNHPVTPIVYWPMLNDVYPRVAMAYAVRSTRVGAPGFLQELRQTVWSVNPNLPLANVATLDEIETDSMAQTSFAMVMLAIAAAVALLLGIVGIYGVISYIATQRTREVGIRMALGAQSRDVQAVFLRHGFLLTGAGIALGIGISLALSRVVSAMLFGVGPMDPATYAAVSLGLAAVALLAISLPARRASRIDPMAALRAER